jgi:hypothetical protein
MVWKGRITKQGVRDLNYYGPRKGKAAPGAPVAATVADETFAPQARPPVTSAIGARDEGSSILPLT